MDLTVEERLLLTEENYRNHKNNPSSVEPVVFSGGELNVNILKRYEGFRAKFKDKTVWNTIFKENAALMAIFEDMAGGLTKFEDEAGEKAEFKNKAGLEIIALNYSLKQAKFTDEAGFRAEFYDRSGHEIYATDNALQRAKFKDETGFGAEFKNKAGLWIIASNYSLKQAKFTDEAGQGMYITDNALQGASLEDESGLEVMIELYEGSQPLLDAKVGEEALMYPVIMIPYEGFQIPEYLQEMLEEKKPLIIPKTIEKASEELEIIKWNWKSKTSGRYNKRERIITVEYGKRDPKTRQPSEGLVVRVKYMQTF